MLQTHTKCSVGAASSPAFTCVDTLEGIKRKEPVSIGELNAFISNSDEQVFVCLCVRFSLFDIIHCIYCANCFRPIRPKRLISFAKPWLLVSTRKMGGFLYHVLSATKKLERSGTSLSCSRCVTSDVTGVVR